MTEPNYLEFLYDALQSPFGIVLAVDDPNRVKQALYRARVKSGDSSLAGLQIRVSPILPHEELWIVKDSKEPA
ncbi:MAG TPA: hypothetical protein VM260_13330 [Pirellula sp.]|nr:hypothetical protein [Pirellula sp.]